MLPQNLWLSFTGERKKNKSSQEEAGTVRERSRPFGVNLFFCAHMAPLSLLMRWTSAGATSLPSRNSSFSSFRGKAYQVRRLPGIKCKAKDTGGEEGEGVGVGGETIQTLAVVGGIVANPVIGVSLYSLKATGCGLPPGPGGALGALEGVSYLVVAGIIGWSIYTKAKTGTGLPNGPFGILGAVEGLSYLTVLAIVVVFGLQFLDRGYLPGPLPGDQCFG